MVAAAAELHEQEIDIAVHYLSGEPALRIDPFTGYRSQQTPVGADTNEILRD